jgi:hypothetical protein
VSIEQEQSTSTCRHCMLVYQRWCERAHVYARVATKRNKEGDVLGPRRGERPLDRQRRVLLP